MGVEGLAAEPGRQAFGIAAEPGPARRGRPAAIDRIADHRHPEMSEMDADLVGPAGRKPAFERAGSRTQAPDQPPARRRGPAAGGQHRHLLAVAGAPPDIAFHRPGGAGRAAPDQGGIGAFDRARLELGGERAMGGVGLGGHHQPAGQLVEPVDDPRPADAPDPRKAGAAMGDQGVDQRPLRVPWRGVDHQAGLFVEHHHVLVLVDDRQRDVLAGGLRVGIFGDEYGENLAGFDPVGRPIYRPRAARPRRIRGCEPDQPGFDQRPRPRPGQFGQRVGQDPVQPPAPGALRGREDAAAPALEAAGAVFHEGE